jgi:hypothetical protein
MQKEVYEKIRPWMKEILGEFLVEQEDIPSFDIMIGSAYARWGCFPGKKTMTQSRPARMVSPAPK